MSQVVVLAKAAQVMEGQGMSYNMIARALGLSEDDVRYLVRRE